MPLLNHHFQELPEHYIFALIEKKLEELQQQPSPWKLLNFGIGDIARPLAPALAEAIQGATAEMSRESSLRGYGPSTGYPFLKRAIAEALYPHLGIEADEIFISDGINSDITSIFDLFDLDNRIALPNPAYPAYRNAALIGGRGSMLHEIACTEESGFLPLPSTQHCDLVILCSPHNPTGAAFTRSELSQWVAYAHAHRALLLYDGAYSGFVTSKELPRSIFEIEGARDVAVELGSFSKSAGFTGLRCSYMVLPKGVRGRVRNGAEGVALHPLWTRRQQIKFNGVAYPVQRGACAALEGRGLEETQAQISAYLSQASKLRDGLQKLGFTCYGGKECPYIWWKVPEGLSSWEFFELLLTKARLLAIPGEGFGSLGKGYVRLSAFVEEGRVEEALARLAHV